MKTKFRVCIIGTGMIANSAHIPSYRHLPDDFEIVGVCDIRPEAAAETAARVGLDKYYTNAEEMLSALKPDLVSVCTPNNFHKPMTILALEHGAHVICEKPIALTLKDAKEMYATAHRCGKILFANQSMRFRADFMAAKDMIQKGMLGDVYFSEFARIRRRGVPRWGMFHIKEMNGGGAFCDIGVHFLDAMNWMLGNPEVLSVSGNSQDVISHLKNDVPPTLAESGAYGGVFTPRPYKDEEFSVEEFASGYIRFAGNKSCSFKVAWAINQPEQFDIRLSGDKAGLYLPEGKLYSTAGGYLTDVQPRIVDESPYKATQPFFMHFHLFDNVLEVLRGEGEYLIKEEEILNISAAIEAFYRSCDEGREIAVSELEA
ncbi:MAG: Gfo/Idh/MocA family oxidoreductase [Clostridia bacterium]|nr:Gfo/Idh/MocA family oxidoreductase [Clostridia bacterium]